MSDDRRGDDVGGDTIVGRAPDPGDERTLVRHEEELSIAKERYEAGSVRARKTVETEQLAEVVPRDFEEAELERAPAAENDSGRIETLPDGSVSIPIFEEELVVTKRTVVRERVIIRKRTVTEQHRIEAELRRERIEIEADPGIDVEDGTGGTAA